jgi:signal transduction histidine kinase
LRSRRFNFSYDASCFITGDIKKLSHIWINLLSNAIEASSSNGIINLNVFTENKDVLVTIQDDGSGITEENIKNIFKADFTTKLNQEGIGMGLDFCKNYLESIDAKIEVISKPGDTTFTVRFSKYANSIK